MKNSYFIFQLPYHTEKFNKIVHIDPFVYEIQLDEGCGYQATHIHRIKNGQFISRKARKKFLLVHESTLQERLFDDINYDRYQGKQIGGGTWLVCSQLGVAFYQKLHLMNKVYYRVLDNIDVIKTRHPMTLYPKYRTYFKECSTYLARLDSMNLLDLLEKTRMEFPECFI
jgi:hypothetical protein